VRQLAPGDIQLTYKEGWVRKRHGRESNKRRFQEKKKKKEGVLGRREQQAQEKGAKRKR